MPREYKVYIDDIIHEYFGIDLRILWDIIANKIPELKNSVKRIVGNSK